MESRERFVAVALLTEPELAAVGNALHLVLPIEDVPDDFTELLALIDEAEARKSSGTAD